MFVRVKDKETRHEFDVPEDSILLAEGSVELVKRRQYPPSDIPRPAKFHIDLSVSTGAAEATPEEE